MTVFSRLPVFLALCCSSIALATNILLTNDDGWAVANIRAQYAELQSAGYDVRVLLLSTCCLADGFVGL